MPLGAFSHLKKPARPLDLVRRDLEQRWTLVHTDYRSGGPACYATIAETGRRLGFITPMSRGFCDSCNRLRVTCTGQMVLCLGHEAGVDLRAPLRAAVSDAELAGLITRALGRKAPGHAFLEEKPPGRPMYQVGG